MRTRRLDMDDELKCRTGTPLPAAARNEVRALPRCLGGSAVILALGVFSACAQYSIGWFTIDGGGGTSTGSVYSVSGTIGQSDAGGTMTNGQYSVTGGFWVLPQAVQTEGAPTLTIAPASQGFATISWTPNTTDFVLQETPTLSTSAWTNSVTGSTNPVVVQITVPAKYFRLHKP